MSGTWGSESRSYNSMLQMVHLISGSTVDMFYDCSPTQNNGKITAERDNLSGEQVDYAYDSLNRLQAAATENNNWKTGLPFAGQWGQSYDYDGFGNLIYQHQTKGTAPNGPEPQLPGYDANGNATGVPDPNSMGTLPAGWDVENRMVSAGSARYAYASDNKRVWRGVMTGPTLTTDEVTFWSVTGQRVGTYPLTIVAPYSGHPTPTMSAALSATEYYFGGKLVKNASGYVHAERLGSVGKYFPYGQERPSATTNGTEKFATYFRDGETGLDYAVNRYHAPGQGRFLSPDPYTASGGPADPGSWNRYAYTRGDPVNRRDPSGRMDCLECDYGDGGGGGDPGDPGDPGGCFGAQFASSDCGDGGGDQGGDGGPPAAPPPQPCPISAITLGGYIQSAPAFYAGGPNKGQSIPSGSRPLENWTYDLMYDSVLYNVDPRLIIAIAEAETHFGADNCAGVPNTNNPFCIGDLKPRHFATIGDAIQFTAQLLGGRIGATTTLGDLYRPGTGLYCNTAECNPTIVQGFLQKQGGGLGRSGVYGPLQSPCYEGADGAFYLKR